MPGIDRRRFLLGTGAALLAASCGGDDEPAAGTTTTLAGSGTDGGGNGDTGTGGTGSDGEGLVLGFAFDRNAFLVAGIPQRMSAVLFATDGGFAALDVAPAELALTARLLEDGSVVEATVARHGDELDRPYYPAQITFPVPGLWEVEADLGDGTTVRHEVNVSDSVTFPQIGDPLPSVATPTTAAPLGVTTICTREPACPFHEVSLDAALAAGRRVALLVSTPAFCQVAICGPVLDLLIDAAPGGLDVIHVEVFPNASGTDTGPASPIVTEALGLTFEPVLYVAGPDGTVTARLDSIYDSTELAAALA